MNAVREMFKFEQVCGFDRLKPNKCSKMNNVGEVTNAGDQYALLILLLSALLVIPRYAAVFDLLPLNIANAFRVISNSSASMSMLSGGSTIDPGFRRVP